MSKHAIESLPSFSNRVAWSSSPVGDTFVAGPGDRARDVVLPEIPAGELVGGRYRLMGKLGHGGMGVVYLAEDTSLKRDVAIKFLHTTARPSDREQFHREAHSMARVANRHVVAIYDMGEHLGASYFVMQYVDGVTLADYLDAIDGGLPVDVALGFATQICEAVDSLHRIGLIHRDIKPSNVMIAGGTEALLMDFGLVQETGIRARGLVSGTPQYLAPEDALGEPLLGDAARRSDIYALGVSIYELIAGRPPFNDEDTLTMLGRLIRERPPALSDLRPDVPPSVERVVMRALEKDPAQRPASCEELMDELRGARSSAATRGTKVEQPTALISDAGAGRAQLIDEVQASLAMALKPVVPNASLPLFESLRRLRPSCVVVDLDLMEPDPRELLAQLRSDQMFSVTRLIAVGACAAATDEDFLATLGVERLVLSPQRRLQSANR